MVSRRAYLYDIIDIMLIVEDSNGVTYRNQTGGVTCGQSELEGVLCPLDIDRDDTERIEKLTCDASSGHITGEIADIIDTILASKSSTSFLKVDRARLKDSEEAWIYVLVDSPPGDASSSSPVTTAAQAPDPYLGPLRGFSVTRGVLTWQNSD